MAFALSIVKLQEALEKPGCPVCRLEHEAAIHSIDNFLWENTNDPALRKPINDAYGFCPQHTQMFVAKEMMSSGPVLGVNIIYALLAKNVAHDLQAVHIQGPKSGWNALMNKLRGVQAGEHKHTLLVPAGRCPICVLVEESGADVLTTLFEVLAAHEERFVEAYKKSSGLCLQHLRDGLEQNGPQNSTVVKFLIDDTVARLTKQRGEMLEYLRKHNWEYRDEKMTPEEQTAWLHTLTFFTGLPESKFDHKLEEF
jgi:hypothetical protein